MIQSISISKKKLNLLNWHEDWTNRSEPIIVEKTPIKELFLLIKTYPANTLKTHNHIYQYHYHHIIGFLSQIYSSKKQFQTSCGMSLPWLSRNTWVTESKRLYSVTDECDWNIRDALPYYLNRKHCQWLSWLSSYESWPTFTLAWL